MTVAKGFCRHPAAHFSLAAALILLSLTSCKKASEELGSGTIGKDTYSNKKLGLKVRFPKNWHGIDGAAAAAQSKRRTGHNIAFLAQISRYPAGDAKFGKSNPGVIILAGRSQVGLKKTTVNQQLKAIRDGLESEDRLEFTCSGFKSRTMGKHKYDYFHAKASVQSFTGQTVSVRQTYAARMHKGYIVCFIMTYISKKDEETVARIIKTARFN